MLSIDFSFEQCYSLSFEESQYNYKLKYLLCHLANSKSVFLNFVNINQTMNVFNLFNQPYLRILYILLQLSNCFH